MSNLDCVELCYSCKRANSAVIQQMGSSETSEILQICRGLKHLRYSSQVCALEASLLLMGWKHMLKCGSD